MNVLVTGGTGILGRCLVERLTVEGHRVRVLSRNPSGARFPGVDVETSRGDLRDPASLAAALAKKEATEAVVHCASDVTSPTDVDVHGTAHLLTAMRQVGVPHLVHVSIVGVDRVPLRYYRAKRQVESIIEAQEVPWTIQRATQFHPFLDALLIRQARYPVLTCPRGLRYQPIAVGDVADRLVQHVNSGPAGNAPDIAGPEVLPVKALATTWLRARHQRRPLLAVPFPGRLGRAFGDGANLAPDRASEGPSWGAYLQAVYGTPRVA